MISLKGSRGSPLEVHILLILMQMCFLELWQLYFGVRPVVSGSGLLSGVLRLLLLVLVLVAPAIATYLHERRHVPLVLMHC